MAGQDEAAVDRVTIQRVHDQLDVMARHWGKHARHPNAIGRLAAALVYLQETLAALDKEKV